jgi:hypothetical protein
MLKAAILFNDDMYYSLFEQSYTAIESRLRQEDWYASSCPGGVGF